MNKFKKITALILCTMLLFGSAFMVRAEDPLTVYSLTEYADNVKTYGRTQVIDTGITCDWSASGIEFNADCEGDVAVTLSVQGGEESKDGYFSVYIDGELLDKRLRVADGKQTLTIAEDLPQGSHSFKLIKQSTVKQARVVFESVSLAGKLTERPADSEYFMEFIGDSITCGHSALCFNSGDKTTSLYGDATKTYAYLTAQNFGADHSFISISGSTCGTMLSEYDYMCKDRDTTPYDYQRKPNVVVINLGTNDGTRTYEYWLEQANAFVTKIRDGYQDQNIPVVFVHSAMQADGVRANLAAAVQTLGGAENHVYVVGFGRSGTHPRVSSHKNDAKRLTAMLVNEGIMPLSALQDDATVTAAEDERATMLSDADYTSGTLSGVSIVDKTAKLEAADAIAPDSDANAVKVTTTGDGTQTRLLTISSNTLKQNVSNTKGIRFYLSYTGELSKNIYIQSGDKTGSWPFEAVEGETNCVELYWNNMPSTMNYVYFNIANSNSINSISFDFGSGAYTAVIDNIEYIRNTYVFTDNPNSSYVVITQLPDVFGNLNGYEAPTTTTTTTTAAAEYDYTVTAADTTYKANAGQSGIYEQTDVQPNGKVVSFDPGAANNYIEFTVKDLPADTYAFSVLSRDYNSRGTYSISVNGTVINDNVNFAVSTSGGAIIRTHDIGVFTTDGGDIVIRFTAKTAGSLYAQYFYFSGTQATTSSTGSSSTSTSITTTATSTTGTDENYSYVTFNSFDSYTPDKYKDYQYLDIVTENAASGNCLKINYPSLVDTWRNDAGNGATYITAENGTFDFSEYTGVRFYLKSSRQSYLKFMSGTYSPVGGAATIPAQPSGGWVTLTFEECGLSAENLAKINGFLLKHEGGDTCYMDEIQLFTPAADDTLYGDVDNNNVVDLKDALPLRQYIAGYEVSINMSAADVYKDSKINGKDLLLLRQYLANYDVELGNPVNN